MKSSQKKRGTEGALNIRNVPEDLLWACSAKANLQRKKLREFVIQVLREATTDIKLFP